MFEPVNAYTSKIGISRTQALTKSVGRAERVWQFATRGDSHVDTVLSGRKARDSEYPRRSLEPSGKDVDDSGES